MPFLLDPSSSIPLYRQLRYAIEDAVAAGEYHASALPSSRALSAELGISRTTVNLAFQELVAEGFIYSAPRSGYRVNRELIAAMQQRAANRQLDPSICSDNADWAGQLVPRHDIGIPEIDYDPAWENYPYPFIYGQVPTESFPVGPWMQALRTALQSPHAEYSLRDAGSTDDPMLVDQLCRSVLPQRGIRADPKQVLITIGAQHGLQLTASALIRPRDAAAVENPGYPDAWHILHRAGADLIPVGIDAAGMMVHSIPDRARIVSITPSHQYPTNVSLGIARRRYLLDRAAETDSFLLEDDYDSEFRYVGRPMPALRSAPGERVVYVASFSKFLAPGVRMGYVVAAAPLIERLRSDRRYSVRHPPGQIQRALALLIESGAYHRALRRHRIQLREKWRHMIAGIRQELGWDFVPPTGGTSLWLKLPPGLDSDQLTAEAARSGVLIESGSTFFVGTARTTSYIRLGYATIPLDKIREGLKVLGAAANRL
ncbi:PLP-dependent aminotransferase family protein [Mycobacterium sp. 141]|uniref:MocR-like pyridoxine biosynthesis transcription factor PdxR n=1 Tax=Mycobacterium sp. 141 TaxID=1120797 RepID=UPI0004777696|nr:PLP-dependent aminotransferase family protein [Mycobacterium sp. 141]